MLCNGNMYVIYLYLYDVSPKGSLPMKRIIRHLIKQQRFPKSTVILADEAQLLLLLCVCVCGTVAAVSGTICSSHLTSFLSVCGTLSLSRSLSPMLLTRLQDALTLSPFSSYAISEGVWKGSTQQAALCCAQTWQQRERCSSFTQKSPNTQYATVAPKHWTHTGLRQNVGNLSSIGHCRADKGTTHEHIYAHTRALMRMPTYRRPYTWCMEQSGALGWPQKAFVL